MYFSGVICYKHGEDILIGRTFFFVIQVRGPQVQRRAAQANKKQGLVTRAKRATTVRILPQTAPLSARRLRGPQVQRRAAQTNKKQGLTRRRRERVGSVVKQ